ncbi:DUF4254 domain-containing protein [Oleidesulfovibrio alaskensis]|jgi:hypothetical protein|uniref:DUF4254 domain-containing protein n=1 Tax=Oleidesulfovibrio alaskensis TaxID=58180 RepID=UPI001A5C8C0C|nr:DUF4254 domain-containing protein [Oleidesulfovibrio alaskensis]MBL3582129.1 DUF4254 domain-containing protein [Oleidesulfovibrio alaskensis]
MSTISFEIIKSGLERAFDAQADATARWHDSEPDTATQAGKQVTENEPALAALHRLVLAQHLMNFKLWHVEDIARRKDVGPEVIADCKYRIDGYNQQRNDYMEKVDICMISLMDPLLPPAHEQVRINTESLGMAVDRLSILSLKMFHMLEQAAREDAPEQHRENCRAKLAVLAEQRHDLSRAVMELLDDYARGVKRPKTYYQFKMYNDPDLNPELYGNRKGKA